MRHILKLFGIATAVAFAAATPRAASAQAKEGTYKGTYSANGTFKATAIRKDRVLLVFEEYGMNLSDRIHRPFNVALLGDGRLH